MLHSDIFIIQPIGSFDGLAAQEFQTQVQAALALPAKRVILDCEAVLFMDSSGLGELILAYKVLKQAGVSLVLCAINEQVKTLLELTDLLSIFDIYTDRAAAEQSLLSSAR